MFYILKLNPSCPIKQKEYKVVMENVQNIKKHKEKYQYTEIGMTYFHSKFAHTSIEM